MNESFRDGWEMVGNPSQYMPPQRNECLPNDNKKPQQLTDFCQANLSVVGRYENEQN